MAGRVDSQQFFATLRDLVSSAAIRFQLQLRHVADLNTQELVAQEAARETLDAMLADPLLPIDFSELNAIRARLITARAALVLPTKVMGVIQEGTFEDLLSGLQELFPPDAPEWEIREPVPVPSRAGHTAAIAAMESFKQLPGRSEKFAVLARLLFFGKSFVCEDFSSAVAPLLALTRSRVSSDLQYAATRKDEPIFLRQELPPDEIIEKLQYRGSSRYRYSLLEKWAEWADEQLEGFYTELNQ